MRTLRALVVSIIMLIVAAYIIHHKIVCHSYSMRLQWMALPEVIVTDLMLVCGGHSRAEWSVEAATQW